MKVSVACRRHVYHLQGTAICIWLGSQADIPTRRRQTEYQNCQRFSLHRGMKYRLHIYH